MYANIMVVLDWSETEDAAIRYAVEIAAKFHSVIYFVIFSLAGNGDVETSYSACLERIIKRVKQQSESYEIDQDLKILFKTFSGSTSVKEILNFAKTQDISLVIVAGPSKSYQGLRRPMSIEQKFTHVFDQSILQIKPPAIPTATKADILVKKVLVPLNASADEKTLIDSIEPLGLALNADLFFYYVVKPMATGGVHEGFLSYIVPPPDLDGRIASAMAYLDSITGSTKQKGLNITCVVDYGVASVRICDYAKQNAFNLIAMLSYKRSRIGDLISGNVINKVLDNSCTPVLVMKPS